MSETPIADAGEDLEEKDDEVYHSMVSLVRRRESQRPLGVSASLFEFGSESESQHLTGLEARYRPGDVEIFGPATSTPWDLIQYSPSRRNNEIVSAEVLRPPIFYCQFRGQRVGVASTGFSVAKAVYGTTLCNWIVRVLATLLDIQPSSLEEASREDYESLVQAWKDIMGSDGYSVRSGLCTILHYEDLIEDLPASQQMQRLEDTPEVLKISLLLNDKVLGNEALWARCILLHTGLSPTEIIERDEVRNAQTQAFM
ncbi:hypothetical protein BGZ60DRAFT_559420 [Tricladium varicosporioides]|nr:hypothetical protein BGZ60DRAFT_559420 [Hymenoscyphus varicosporioides]